MKIIQLKSENTQNLKAVELTPAGNVVKLKGPNGAGKSTVLDSILSTLTGKRIEDFIKHGEEKAEVEIDCGDFIAKKRWTQKGEYLEVLTKDGDKKKSPQTFLDEIIGRLSFDPMEFASMKPVKQMEILKELAGLDFSDLEAEQQKAYEERTVLNSKIKGTLAQLKTLEPPDPKTSDEELTFKDELEKLNQLREKRAAYLKALGSKNDRVEYLCNVEDEVEAIKIQIETLQRQLKELEEKAILLKSGIDQIVLPPEVTEAQIQDAELALQDIEQKNITIRAAKRYRTFLKDGEKLQKEADALSERLERIQQDKATRIANAEFPLLGLSLGDEAVFYNGEIFGKLSTGEQIKISTAIAMKLNPKLKVIFIREGSLLDKAGLEEVAKVAQENDYQVFIELVDQSGRAGLYIEDASGEKINNEEAFVNAEAEQNN